MTSGVMMKMLVFHMAIFITGVPHALAQIPPVVILPTPIAPAHLCGNEADIVFCLDRSGSVGSKFPYLRAFSIFLANDFKLNTSGVGFRAGIVSYGLTGRRDSELNEFGFEAFKANALNIKPLFKEALTNIAEGLQLSYDMLTEDGKGARRGVPKFLIFTNDGKKTWGEDFLPIAQKLHDDPFITVISIGITDTVKFPDNEEVLAIASEPKADNYIHVENYELLNTTDIFTSLNSVICEVLKEPRIKILTVSASNCTIQGSVIYILTETDLETSTPAVKYIPDGKILPFNVSNTGVITRSGVFEKEKYTFQVLVQDTKDAALVFLIWITINVTRHEQCDGVIIIEPNCSCTADYFWKESFCVSSETDKGVIERKLFQLENLKASWDKCCFELYKQIDNCANRTRALDELITSYSHCQKLKKDARSLISTLKMF